MDVAQGMATAGSNPCPEYPEFGIPQPDGSFTYVAAPTNVNAACSSVPVTAMPVMYCAK
jgi:hypothetical protein